jgi:hypothetical protein
MNFRKLAPLGLGAAITLGALGGVATVATAQTKQQCHMKGVWNGNTSDVFEFDAAYTYNKGEDDFSGVYTNPGISQANISASARGGVWNIVLSYVDPKNKGAFKKLVGKGQQDGSTHQILVTGTFQWFPPGSAAATQNGTFSIAGTCK